MRDLATRPARKTRILGTDSKYYGNAPALRLTGLMFLCMVLAGLAVDGLFHLFGWVPAGPRAAHFVEHARFAWNYSTWLDLGALALASCLYYLHRRGASDRAHSDHERVPARHFKGMT